LFVAVIFHRFRSGRVNDWKWFAAGSAVLLFVVTCVVGIEPSAENSPAQAGNLVVLTLPLACMFAAAWFRGWLDGQDKLPPLLQKLAVATFVTVAALPVISRLAGAPAGRMAYPPYHPPALCQMGGYLKPDEFMVSDQPWAVAWYGDRRCLWLPYKPEQFYLITDRHQHIAAMLLTPITLNARFLTEIIGTEWWYWAAMLGYLQFPSDFPLRAGAVFVGAGLVRVEWDLYHPLDLRKVNDGVHMVLVCDRKRWVKEQPQKPIFLPSQKMLPLPNQ
jgi:hypothetical protein